MHEIFEFNSAVFNFKEKLLGITFTSGFEWLYECNTVTHELLISIELPCVLNFEIYFLVFLIEWFTGLLEKKL